MILQIIKLKSNLSEEQLFSKAKDREPLFKAIPGLLQKYYVKTGIPNQYGGIYIWDSKESLNNFKESQLAKSIPEAYEIIESPDIELMNIMFKLRE